MSKRIMVSAMEVSADMHLSHLVGAIRRKDPSIEFYGLAGHLCASQGVKLLADITHKGTIGFIEPLKHIPSLLYHLYQMKSLLEKDRPDLLIVVDGQGFNMPLAAHAKKLGIPVVYYIAPQEWQWGTEAGGKKVLEVVDVILAIFKDEADFYNRLGGRAYFNGHPLLDIVHSSVDKKSFCREQGLDPARPILGLFPGSRLQELKYLLPVMLGTAHVLRTARPDIQCVISAATPDCERRIHQQDPGIKVIPGRNYDIMAHSDLLLMCSGTATLEAACLFKPMIGVYKFSPISHWIIKKTVGHKLPKYFLLPNLWLNKMAVPEFIQVGVDAENLSKQVVNFFKDPSIGARMVNELKQLEGILGNPGSLEKNAQVVVELLKTK